MAPILMYLGLVLAGIILGIVSSWLISSKLGRKRLEEAGKAAEQLQTDAKKQIETLKREKLLEAKDEWYRLKQEFENESRQKRQELEKLRNEPGSTGRSVA